MALAALDGVALEPTSNGGWVLRAAAGSKAALPREIADSVRVTSATQIIRLSSTPTGLVKVYRNGQLMKLGEDYDLSGTSIMFRPVAQLSPGHLVTAIYFQQ